MVPVRLGQCAWALAPLLLGACDPRIIAFDVQPGRACAGDTVHISWKVRGTPHLLAVRRTEDSVDLIRYTIVAESRGKQVSSSKDVITFTSGTPKSLVSGASMLGTDSVAGRDSLGAAAWHDLVQVGEVISDSGRELRVRHGGREGLVGPSRQPSAVWRGLPMGGVWEIRSGLKASGAAGKRASPPPARLALRVHLECAPAKRAGP